MIRNRLLLILCLSCLCVSMQAQTDDYGAAAANERFVSSMGMLGGRTDFDYLKLKNHPANSGVPLGGIGAGNIEFAPDGRFVRIGLNNIHLPIRSSVASFFTLWRNGTAVRLVRDSLPQYGMQGVKETYYTGLFPRAEIDFGTSLKGISVKVRAFSSLIPHDVKNSSLPVAYFDVELVSKKDEEVSVAFSWEDFIGRGIREPESIKGMDGQLFGQNRNSLCNGEAWPERKREQTYSESWSCGSLAGVRQFAGAPLKPRRANFQNYVSEVAVLAQTSDGEVTVLPSFDISGSGEEWEPFLKAGEFMNMSSRSSLSTPEKQIGGSAVAVKTSLKAKEKKTVRFMLVWFFPEMKIDRENDPLEYYWSGGSDYGRYFHNFFSSMDQLVRYADENREDFLGKTTEWQLPVLDSSLPDWYKFKLINSGYVIYTNVILNRKGDMTVNEGGMGGLAGTMDQRLCSHPFYQKFFTQLDRSEMKIFADAQQAKGYITHFIGHYYYGLGTVGGRVPTEDAWLLDNTCSWIIQFAKDYEQTGDMKYLRRYAGKVYNGMSFLKSLLPEGVSIPLGETTYDDFRHPPVFCYAGSVYLAALKAAQVVAEAMQDTAQAKEYSEQFSKTQKDMLDMLWNGRFFSYGCEIDGSDRRDSIMFTGQLAGQFLSRYCGCGDVIPMDMTKASLIAQFKTSLSHTPDYYANKVWDISLGHGIDMRGSQCWPFYLEAYTGYAAIQAGYVLDGLDIMKHIQLVHLRKGWEWCQNLWNPAELTYMTAPVVWFSTDVLAGAGLNVPRQEFRLAPIVEGNEIVRLPLYYPSFWATLTLNPKTRKASLEVTKTFGNQNVVISRIVSEKNGEPTADRKVMEIPAFSAAQGNVLDLSSYWDDIVQQKTEEAILPRADKVDFKIVDYRK